MENWEEIDEMEGGSPTMDRCNEAFAKYNMNVDQERVKKAVESIRNEIAKEKSEENLKLIFNCIDLTTLKPDDNDESVLKMVEKVNEFDEKYPDIKNVASVCVYPCYAGLVSKSLEADNVKTCCVSGGFPSSQTFFEIKIAETSMAIHDGAEEIDVVQNSGRVLDGDYDTLSEETDELKEICADKTFKVIIETGALKSLENVKKAALLAMYSGADFVKTSTGKEVPGADPESFYVMCQAVKEYAVQTGIQKGVKAAGGIRSVDDALLYFSIVKKVLGKDWLNNKLFRIGASSLANNLLAAIGITDIKF